MKQRVMKVPTQSSQGGLAESVHEGSLSQNITLASISKKEGAPSEGAGGTVTGAARQLLHLKLHQQIPNSSGHGHGHSYFFFLVALLFTLNAKEYNTCAFVVLPHAGCHRQNYCVNQQQHQHHRIFEQQHRTSPPSQRPSSDMFSLRASTTPNDTRGDMNVNKEIPMFTSNFDNFFSYISDGSQTMRVQDKSKQTASNSNRNSSSGEIGAAAGASTKNASVDTQSQSLLVGTTMLKKTYDKLASTRGFSHPKTIETLHKLIQSFMNIRTTPQNETFIYTTGKNILEHILQTKEKQHRRNLELKSQGQTTDVPTATTSIEELYKNDFIIFQTLAHLYTKLKMYDQANELYTQVIYEMQCIILGKDHLETIQTLKTVANIYNMQGEDLNAREYYLRCFIACRNNFGLYNEHTISTLHSLSHLYMTKASEGSNSDSYYYKAFIINQKCYTILVTNGYSKYVPPNLTFHTVHNLALYFHHHHHSKEEQRYEKAQSLYEQCFTKIHHYKLQQQQGQGQMQRRQSLTRKEEQKDKEMQLDTSLLLLLTLHNLSTLYYDQKQFDKAIRTTQQCFLFRKQVLGLYHYDTIVTLCNLGMMYYYQGSSGQGEVGEEEWNDDDGSDRVAPFVLLSRAKQILGKCMELQMVALGEDHDETILTKDYIHEVERMIADETKSFDGSTSNSLIDDAGGDSGVAIMSGSQSKSSMGEVVASIDNVKSETNTAPVDASKVTTKTNKAGNTVTTAKPMWNNNDAGNQLLQ